MTILAETNRVNYFKELPFYNEPIKKPEIRRLKNNDLLSELLFFEQSSIIKTNQAFKEYAISYKVEIVEKKDPIVQLEGSKSSIRNLFSDLLGKTKGFKYQITVKILLKKYKLNREIEFSPVYFNSLTKTVINNRFELEESFQEILYSFDAWINEASGWITESVESQYINISAYRPLVGNYYIDLPIELRGLEKGLINIKNKDQKCILWCHVRHINLTKEHPGEIKKVDRIFANNLNYDGTQFPVKESDFNKIEVQNNICINLFGYENKLVFPIYVSNKKMQRFNRFITFN